MEKIRCDWVTKEIEEEYHDNVWGIEEHNDKNLFEMLILESMQAGLSWITILNKRENFKKAFDNFDPIKISKYNEKDFDRLMNDAGIIRNKLKITAAINNAKLFLELQEKYGSFNKFIWSYVNNKPIINNWKKIDEVPASTEISDKISKDLKTLGFKFVGTTIIYAYMQAIGMVDDHLITCFKRNK